MCMEELTPKELALLADYFSQELPPDKVAEVRKWIDGDTERSSFVADLSRSRLASDLGESPVLSNEDIHRRISSISLNLSKLRVSEKERACLPGIIPDEPSAHNKKWGRVFHYPAMWHSVSGFLVGAALIVSGVVFTIRGNTVTSDGVSVYSTNAGERATILLPDGSAVKLNVASRIQVPSNYSENNRKVVLDGEAIFSVDHSGGKPFTVISGSSVTRVLGTRFVVRHYQSDSVALIAVQNGKVSVGDKVVSAGEEVLVSDIRVGQVTLIKASRFDFESGMLNLDKVTLMDAIPDLNRWYNADIKLGSEELAMRKIVGGFKAGSVTDLAAILELTFDVRVVRQERTIILYAK